MVLTKGCTIYSAHPELVEGSKCAGKLDKLMHDPHPGDPSTGSGCADFRMWAPSAVLVNQLVKIQSG